MTEYAQPSSKYDDSSKAASRSWYRIWARSQIRGFTLVLIGVVPVWATFDPSNVLTWGVVGGMGLYLIAVLLLYIRTETR